MKILVLVILNSILVSFAFAQEKKLIRQGNASYKAKDYDNSELKYRKALEKKATSFDAGFNLGDALFRQKKYDEAAKQFQNLAHSETTKENIAKAYHNLGNSYMVSKDEQQQPKFQEAVDAYKNALRNNPKDDETRYNLAYAQKMLQQQKQQQKQNKDKNKDQNKDKNKKDQQKNKDKKDQDKNKQDKNKQDQNKKDQKKQDQKDQDKKNKDKQDKNKQNQPKDQKDQQKQQQKKQQIPKEKAEQMLKALENDEKDLQKKMKMQKVKGQKVKVEKDW